LIIRGVNKTSSTSLTRWPYCHFFSFSKRWYRYFIVDPWYDAQWGWKTLKSKKLSCQALHQILWRERQLQGDFSVIFVMFMSCPCLLQKYNPSLFLNVSLQKKKNSSRLIIIIHTKRHARQRGRWFQIRFEPHKFVSQGKFPIGMHALGTCAQQELVELLGVGSVLGCTLLRCPPNRDAYDCTCFELKNNQLRALRSVLHRLHTSLHNLQLTSSLYPLHLYFHTLFCVHVYYIL